MRATVPFLIAKSGEAMGDGLRVHFDNELELINMPFVPQISVSVHGVVG